MTVCVLISRSFSRANGLGSEVVSAVWFRLIAALGIAAAFAPLLQAAEPGNRVVVVYNSRVPESKDIANHYAERRNVPTDQIIGLELPTDEIMTRASYRDELAGPLLQFMKNKSLLVYDPPASPRPTNAKIRYVVLCYGVPLRIGEEPSLYEAGEDKLQPGYRRNGAAVDSELCTLPTQAPTLRLAGPLQNPGYAITNAMTFNPINGLLIVARLDGPSAAVARRLVDKAMFAETNGLWGRAYFDLRGITNGPYKMGDDWIRAASESSRNYGFETIIDNNPDTFPDAFPMSQIALYAGWYTWNVCGPFARPKVEFMEGAFAYHLYSFSASTLRTTTKLWCGPLLAAGAAATMGSVDEPYLDGTPDIGIFFDRWLSGCSFGEAAYICQKMISWQTTVIGDPLYRPFGQDPRALHESLERSHSKLIEWSHLRVVNRGLNLGMKTDKLIDYLKTPAQPQDSAVLTEKLADLYDLEGKESLSLDACQRALELNPTPQQKVRLTLRLANKLETAGEAKKELALLQDFQEKTPEYPDQHGLTARILELARRLDHGFHSANSNSRH